MKKILTLFLSMTFFLSITTCVFAANKNGSLRDESKNEILKNRYEVAYNYLAKLDSKRAKAFALESKINKLTQEIKLEDNEKEKNELIKQRKETEKEYQKLLAEIDYFESHSEELANLKSLAHKVKKNDSGTITIMYSDDYPDPTYEGVDLYYDNDSMHYVVSGYYYWPNDNAWDEDKVGSGDVGGYDGFYVGVDEPIDRFNYGFNLYDSNGNPVSTYIQHDGDNYGDDWLWQDTINSNNVYNSDYGSGHVFFEFEDPLSPGELVECFAGYAHTWETTSITGIAVSANGGGVSWTSTTNRWKDEVWETVQF